MCKLDWKSSLPSVIEKELGLIAQKLLWKQSQELDMPDHQEHLADLGHTLEGAARVSPSSSPIMSMGLFSMSVLLLIIKMGSNYTEVFISMLCNYRQFFCFTNFSKT